MKSAFSRKRRSTNIDQLLRDDLLFGKSTKSIGARVEEIKRNNRGAEQRRIVFEEAKQELRANELIDFSRVIVLAGMDAFVGTSSGVLKGLTLSKSSFVNLRVANQQTTTAENADQPVESDRSLQAISAISFTGPDQMEVLVGRRNGQVDMFNAVTEQFSTLFTVPSVSTDNGQAEIRGIHTVGRDRILTAQGSGALAIWDGSGQRLSAEDWTAGDQLLTMRAGPTATSSAAGQQQDGVGPEVFATGGKENPLKLWDLATQKCTFTAKNVRPDKLELRVPVWVTCCRFLDNTGKCIATSTGKGQLRVYDTRAQRRPVVEEAWVDKGQEEEPIQALSTCCREWNVLAGNTRGELGLFDMRSNAKSRLASKYKGFAGAIRCIDASPNRPEILSCGIDRFAIVHDLNSRAVLRKIYCKVQLNCCLLCENNALQQPKQQKQRRPKSAGDAED